MPKILFKCVPFDKSALTLALESGVDGLILPKNAVEDCKGLARCQIFEAESFSFIKLNSKKDEEKAVEQLKNGKKVVISHGWEIIPIENLLAQSSQVAVEVHSKSEALLAAGILEVGVDTVVVCPEAVGDLKGIIADLSISQGKIELVRATLTKIEPVGLGHRVCVDTMSMLQKGQGMLVGNSSAFTFLVNAETEHNDYVAARPFRINAGAVHAYAICPGDKTRYLEEIKAGDEVLIVDHNGNSKKVGVGRAKVEQRPMLFIEAEIGAGGPKGAVFLQNAETIRLVNANGEPVSVVQLKVGDTVLCHTDMAGRHFGMRIVEDIIEA
ncbi:3-dehydroquinate synthase II family protein [Desulfovibrio litoralis]|uniref:3-dehydroquinate synthase II n=1 Tax=Desulfovibrio litoralis DSM 11393 TaxID=1121455 RepID=A0A1M7S8A7_9BACT|nr:3-dehydroquinate synthase II family protein [Desulfovibrio litoralis]SHN54711.1 3-dehydroquinate synthase II [Desulfovibrio litoralis DSM 11393]